MHPETVAERARQRLKDEMRNRGISQRDLADVLTRRTGEKWTQSRVGKVLTGRVELQINVLHLMAEASGVSLVEVIRDRGLEFYAELTPTEVRMLERLRQRPHLMQGVLYILELRTDTPLGVVGTKKKAGRPLNSAKPPTQPS